jgi:hypothetical protein
MLGNVPPFMDTVPAIGSWASNSTASLVSSATIADNAITYTNPLNLVGDGSFTQAGSFFQITSPGYYRFTYSLQISGSISISKAYGEAGIKRQGVASWVPRSNKISPLESYVGLTYISKSIVLKCDAATADILTNTNYQVAARQQNPGVTTYTISDIKFSIEYSRGL